MTGLPEEVLVGVSLGLLAGAGPTFLIGAVAFVSATLDGRRLTGWVAVSVAFAGAGTTASAGDIASTASGPSPDGQSTIVRVTSEFQRSGCRSTPALGACDGIMMYSAATDRHDTPPPGRPATNTGR